MSGPVLTYLQAFEHQLLDVSLEVLGQARVLADQLGVALYAILMGDLSTTPPLEGLPLEGLYWYRNAPPFFNASTWGMAVLACIKELTPAVFLLPSTPEGRSLAPFVSARLGTGLTSGCTGLAIHPSGLLLQTRPAFEGNRLADIITPDTQPQMATVHAGVFPLPPRKGSELPPMILRDFPEWTGPLEVLSFRRQSSQSPLEDQKILVAVGGGLQRAEDLDLFRELSSLLGGELACSRVLVERGWLPPDRQIGLSGNAVWADLLITFGISGSLQFCSGIAAVKTLIAVNTNADAPIFSRAHHGYVCDMLETARLLCTALHKQHENPSGPTNSQDMQKEA